MRTPHLRTDLTAAEVSQTITEALKTIDELSKKCERWRASYDNLLNDWDAGQDEIKALNEQIINQARTIERYQRETQAHKES